jgi:hypothetical protein
MLLNVVTYSPFNIQPRCPKCSAVLRKVREVLWSHESEKVSKQMEDSSDSSDLNSWDILYFIHYTLYVGDYINISVE